MLKRVENFDEVSQNMKESEGYKLQMDVDGSEMTLVCTLISTTIAGKAIMIMKLMNAAAVAYLARADGTEAWVIKTETPMNFYIDVSKTKKDTKKVPAKGIKATEKESAPDRDKNKKSTTRQTTSPQQKEQRKKKNVSTSFSVIEGGDKKSSKSNITNKQKERKLASNGSDRQSYVSQTSTTLNRLMRTSFSRRVEATANRLRMMRKAFALIFFVTAVLAIVHNIVFSMAYEEYTRNMDDIAACGDNYADMLVLVRKLRLFQLTASTLSETERAAGHSDILSLSNEIADRHLVLEAESGLRLNRSAQAIFTQPSLTAHVVQNDKLQKLTALSLNDAVNILVSRSSRMANFLAQGNSTAAASEMRSVSSIVLDTLGAPMSTLMHYHLEAYLSDSATMSISVFFFSIIPLVAIYGACAMVIMTIFVKTNAEAKVLYRLFLDVPKVRIKMLFY
jgi:hypothetical protein